MDEKFEIVIIEKIDASSLLKTRLLKYDERFMDNQNNKVISTKKAEISFKEPQLLQLDGEVIGKIEQLTIKIIPEAVNFITHNDNSFLS